MVLTSKYSHINGFLANDGMTFNESQWTFPKELQKNGYYTAIVGKYHLNSFPTDGGFDYWKILDGQGEYYQPDFFDNSPKNRVEVANSHVTDAITET